MLISTRTSPTALWPPEANIALEALPPMWDTSPPLTSRGPEKIIWMNSLWGGIWSDTISSWENTFCYNGKSMTLSGIPWEGDTAVTYLSGNAFSELYISDASKWASCLPRGLPVGFASPARNAEPWIFAMRFATPSLSRSCKSLDSFNAVGAPSSLSHLLISKLELCSKEQ